MISQRSRYALRALLLLADVHGAPVSAGEIARAARIPRKFLEQILLDLKREGLVESRRGKTGGYVLRRPADTITFGEVLRLVEGPLAPLPCLSRTAYRRCEDCESEGTCTIRRVFAEVANAARLILDGTTIAEAARERGGRASPLLAEAEADAA